MAHFGVSLTHATSTIIALPNTPVVLQSHYYIDQFIANVSERIAEVKCGHSKTPESEPI